MKVQTLSIVVGTSACNAMCKGCVSKMTTAVSACSREEDAINKINGVANMRKSLLYAKQCGVSTVLITGRGEPTLCPQGVSRAIKMANKYDIPFIELQTNGICISKGQITDNDLSVWAYSGLNTICLSAKSEFYEDNAQYFGNSDYPSDLSAFFQKLHFFGFSIRFSIIMMKGGIETYERVQDVVHFCKKNNVEQLTLRNLSAPTVSQRLSHKQVHDWCLEHQLSNDTLKNIFNKVDENSILLYNLMHGAEVRDFQGQNICLSNCLTYKPDPDEIRQLIYSPADGHLRYDWVHEGAILF